MNDRGLTGRATRGQGLICRFLGEGRYRKPKLSFTLLYQCPNLESGSRFAHRNSLLPTPRRQSTRLPPKKLAPPCFGASAYQLPLGLIGIYNQYFWYANTMLYGVYDIKCPNCGSHEVDRIHRTFFEKLLLKNPKFRCYKCKREFFRKKRT